MRPRSIHPAAALAVIAMVLALLGACTAMPSGSPPPAPAPSTRSQAPTQVTPTPTFMPPAPTFMPPTPTFMPPTPGPSPAESPRTAVMETAARTAVASAAPGAAVVVESISDRRLRLAGTLLDAAGRDAVVRAVAAVPGVRSVDLVDLVVPDTVVVTRGATFWTIARALYGNGSDWTRLAEANPELDPNALPVGAIVVIPPGEPVIATGELGMRWSASADALRGGGRNPAADQHGNADVWAYLSNHGYVHDQDAYVPLPRLDGNQWTDPRFLNLILGPEPGGGGLRMHPYGGDVVSDIRSAVLAWRSPVSGRIEVRAQVRTGTSDCLAVGTGVVVWIDRGDTALYRLKLPPGGYEMIRLTTEVVAGESIHLVVEPGYDARCDTTFVTLTLERL